MIVFLMRLRHRVARALAFGRRTGPMRWDGTPHQQPRMWRRAWCRLRHRRHMPKFGAHPRGSCVHCEWWPQ